MAARRAGMQEAAPLTKSSDAATRTKPIAFSWLEPHRELVLILVGPDRIPFGLQKNFLCSKSSYYRQRLADIGETVYIEGLPNCPVEVFGCVQNFMYTGAIIPADSRLPSYEVLTGVWKLGHELGVDGLCEHALDAMVKVQVATARVPSTSVLAKVWKDTPEGCSIRKLLLAWAVAYLHTSDSKAEFAKSLPQNVLSELAVAMVTSGTSPLVQLGSDSVHSKHAHPTRKSVHFVDQDGDEEPKPLYPVKKHRR